MDLSGVFDTIGMQPQVLANEVVSNSLLSYALDMTGISERYFEGTYGDSDLSRSIKQGIWVSGLGLGGRILRTYIPQLQLFGSPSVASSG